jgi:hypothetical protein
VVLAALRDGLYNVVLFLHIVSVVIAFAPAVINPMTSARIKRDGGEAGLRAAARSVRSPRATWQPRSESRPAAGRRRSAPS